jgi:hypothetical protein
VCKKNVRPVAGKPAAPKVISIIETPDLFFFHRAMFDACYDRSRAEARQYMRGKRLSADTFARLNVAGSHAVGSVLAAAFFYYDHVHRMEILHRVTWLDPFSNSDWWALFLDEGVTREQLMEMAKLRVFNFLIACRVFCPDVMVHHPSIKATVLLLRQGIELRKQKNDAEK